MTIQANETQLKTLLKRLEDEHGTQELKATGDATRADLGVQELLYSFFLWESSPEKARQAVERVTEAVVDYNELRICMLDDLVGFLPSRYPRAEERSLRLLATLNDLFRKEHEVSLVRVTSLPKRDARNYLLSLDGIPHFVAARIALLCSGSHAFPLDERLCAILVNESIVPKEASVDEAINWIERAIRAGEALGAYALLEVHAQSIIASHPKATGHQKKTKESTEPSSDAPPAPSKKTKGPSKSEKSTSPSQRKKSE